MSESTCLCVHVCVCVYVCVLTGNPLSPTTWSESLMLFNSFNMRSSAIFKSVSPRPAFEECLIMSYETNIFDKATRKLSLDKQDIDYKQFILS